MLRRLKFRRVLAAENNLLRYQLETSQQENEEKAVRISILEGQCELLEQLQEDLAKLEEQNKQLDIRNTRLIIKNQALGDANATYRMKYGNISDDDIKEWRRHLAEKQAAERIAKEEKAKEEQQKQTERRVDHDPYPEE